MMGNINPHSANVPGDFYVADNCCTMCEVPIVQGDGKFGVIENHCYVKREPETQAELEQMIDVIQCAEFDCVRYRGTDRSFQLKIVENGNGIVCDNLPSDLRDEVERQEREIPSERLCIENLSSSAFPIAFDDCGNFVVLDAKIAAVYFWDHEIGTPLFEIATDFADFIERLEPFDTSSINLKPGQVKRVWIEPGFLESLREKGDPSVDPSSSE